MTNEAKIQAQEPEPLDLLSYRLMRRSLQSLSRLYVAMQADPGLAGDMLHVAPLEAL